LLGAKTPSGATQRLSGIYILWQTISTQFLDLSNRLLSSILAVLALFVTRFVNLITFTTSIIIQAIMMLLTLFFCATIIIGSYIVANLLLSRYCQAHNVSFCSL
jgi:hypothetical protein